MTIPDIALIAVAAVAAVTVTAAILITCWHLHLRSYRRTLDRVRARRDAYKAEAAELRDERAAARRLTFAEHADTAVIEDPVAYTLVHPADRTAYLPAFEGDRLGYDDVRRQVAR